ncbi:EAL domain-containing protein [Amphritea sp. 1_MG-2023]|uniref:EAL domain-containing protein n=1 Tax=Amphritea sp. 1_MG-2023 TaxID=3062670 RepID=UPI0026E1D358|nr:EAL domain-containing protein [Amphritea sp. 1_MG-2023]MDO6561841.1 EAL domain-containing protein [Amphritea sp. 1_MG-2023]
MLKIVPRLALVVSLFGVMASIMSYAAEMDFSVWRDQHLTSEEITWLEQHPQLEIGIDPSFAPYESINEAGDFVGITADYFHLLEQRLGIAFVPKLDKRSWHEVLKGARHGEYDLISCLVKTDERQTYLDFTEPYITSFAVIIGLQGPYVGSLDRLKGKTVAIHKGHFTNELLKRDYPEITIINTATLQQALEMVSMGDADAFVGDATAASYVMKKEGIHNLSFSGQTEYQSAYRIGVNQANTILLAVIQKALSSITEQERIEIQDHWSGMEFPQGVPLERLVKIGAVVFVIFLLFIYWNIRLRRSEAAYRLSEQRFKNLVKTSDGMMWEVEYATNNIVYMSENVARILGYPVERWLEPGFWQEHIHPDDRDRVITYSHAQAAAMKDYMSEYRFLKANGEIAWIRDMVRVVKERGRSRWLRGLMLDITHQKNAELLMLRSESRFRELIESLPAIAVQGYDEERRVIYWNDASETLYGFSRAEVIGQRLEDLIIPSNMREGLIEHHKAWLEDGVPIPAAELELLCKDGSLVPVFSSHVMLKDADHHQNMYCIDVNLVEQKRARAELTQLAHYDSLTQLPNRRTFADRLQQLMKSSRREGEQVAVMMIDLDNFKEVNDTLGHDYGDRLLKEAAKRLTDSVRETDTVARLGGDEFLVILGNIGEVAVVERVARTILSQLSEPFDLDDNRAFVSASIGITLYPVDAMSLEVLMKNADQAMYAAKAAGRNRFHYFTPEMEAAAQRRSRMLNELREAIDRRQLEVYYQPIIDLASGQLVKAEALLRWNHPKGQVPPIDFIPLAEETGLIVEIGNWVFDDVVQQVSQWKQQFNMDVQIGVNTSPVQYQDENCFTSDWFSRMLASGLSPANLCVEITEGLLMEAGSSITDKLLQFRDHGIEVALDDFGTGYSSLSYLKQFDIDYLKIDKSFVDSLSAESQDLVLCEAIIVMAHTLGIKVIAEGVETERQKELLIDIDCDYCQGYLFGRPLPAEAFAESWLELNCDPVKA